MKFQGSSKSLGLCQKSLMVNLIGMDVEKESSNGLLPARLAAAADIYIYIYIYIYI